MLIIREAREEELLKVSELWGDFMAYNAAFNDSFKIKKRAGSIFVKEMKERKQNPDCRLAVAEQDGKLIGFCYSYISLKPVYFKLEKFGFIGDLFVREEHRRQGTGTRLVEDSLEFFRRRKVKQIELLVSVKNADAIRFWETLGFEQLLTWMYNRA